MPDKSFFLPFLVVLFFPFQSIAQFPLEKVRLRLLDEILESSVNHAEVNKLVQTQQTNGSWPGINYEDVSRTGFEHAQHLDNMQVLSRAYWKARSAFYQDDQVQQTVLRALDFWLKHDFICDNWWWNQIGTPQMLVEVLLLLDDELSEQQRKQGAAIVNRANLNAWGARPGGDLIKIAGIVGKLALFERDEENFQKAVDAMVGEIKIAEGRGLQPDMSFQHRKDEVISTLSYGKGYAHAFARWIPRLVGTKYQFPEHSMKLLIDFYLDGICQSMIYGKYMDPGAKNRSITRRSTLSPAGPDIPQKLLQGSHYRNDELKRIIGVRKGEKEDDWNKTWFFWQSEYFSHQRPGYFTSVRMFSSRNHNIEVPYNSEGLKNHHYADGSNFISRTGTEYKDIFPVWDRQKIPGTTVVQKPSLPEPGEIQKKGLTDFVGAVTDGNFGTACFDFKSPHDPLEARKAWFFFDKQWVCLGAGIHSDAEYPVYTTLNQCLLKDEVFVKKDNKKEKIVPGQHVLKDISWVYHDQIAYFFSTPTEVHLANTNLTGSWYEINHQSWATEEQISKEVFQLYLDHGRKPRNEKYAYTVIPSIDIADMDQYEKRAETKILANTNKIQAVKHQRLNLAQLIFYQPGKIAVNGKIEVNARQPGLIMVQYAGKNIKRLTVADPSRKFSTFEVIVNAQIEGSGKNWEASWLPEEKKSRICIDLPSGEYAGKSVIVDVE